MAAMTFDEIYAEVDELLLVDDWPGIARLITPENVDTVVRCEGTVITDTFQGIASPEDLLQYYLDLLFLIEDAKTKLGVDDVLPLFIPFNVLAAQVGEVYELGLVVLEEWFDDLGYLDPPGEAETAVVDFYSELTLENQQKIGEVC